MGQLRQHDHREIFEGILSESFYQLYDYNNRTNNFELHHSQLEDAYQDKYGAPAGRILYQDLLDEVDEMELLDYAWQFNDEVNQNVAYG